MAIPTRAWSSARAAGGALVSWQVGSLAEAVAAERAGCSFIVAQGTEAGGHVRGTTSLLPLLSQVLDAVRVPVVAAGRHRERAQRSPPCSPPAAARRASARASSRPPSRARTPLT